MSGRGEVITIVSGLPRSGTSLMMQMLAAGGLPVLADEERPPDEDNPRGYFEVERVKRLRSDASWLGEARGHALKVVAPLLQDLPSEHAYRVIFMERPLGEVLASQARMIERMGGSVPEADPRMADAFDALLARVWNDLAARDIPLHRVAHRRAIDSPRSVAEEVARFCQRPLDVEAMVAVVDPTLFRQTGAAAADR